MNRNRIHSALAALAGGAAVFCATPSEAQCVGQSPPHTVALVELYTSEGCNSCPPADKWVSRLDRNGFSTDQVVALALHVDYWDRLGWKDRFASARFSERQRILSSVSGARAVYTPGVFLNLREFRAWGSTSQFAHTLERINARPAGADIRLEIEPSSSAQLSVKGSFKLKPGTAARNPQAFVALYESRLSTQVRAGENRGVTLRHDYVVREWIGPIGIDGAAEFKKTLALEHDWNAKNLGLAAFVEDLGTGEILQTIALPACVQGSS